MGQMFTTRGYDFYEVSSALQKSIRRCDKKTAAYFAMELFESGYHKYVWKRLFTISAEDVKEYITSEIDSLLNGFIMVNDGSMPSGRGVKPKGRIFVTKAVFLLCDAIKSRDTDHANIIVYDRRVGISDAEIESYLNDVRKSGVPRMPIPDYAFDCHTRAGKCRGKSKDDFLREEIRSLKPVPVQGNLFDDLV